jgi:riboflavin biosynthesis pyrimidine reductase
MTTNPFKVTIHMVSSVDGMIARKDNSVSWFETTGHYEKGIDITKQEMEDFL